MPAISEKRIFNLLGRLYDPIQDGSTDFWTPIYHELADILDSGAGSLNLFIRSDNKFKVLATNVDPKVFVEYDTYYQHVSPFRDEITRLKDGEYFSRVEYCSNEDFEETEIYQDYFRKLGIYYYEYYVLYRSPTVTGGISFSRPKSRPGFTANERKALDFLLPHMQRVFQHQMTILEAEQEKLRMAEVLSQMHQSVIVVDNNLRIVYHNSAAQKIIDKNDGLAIGRDAILYATSPASNKELRRVLDCVFSQSQIQEGLNGSMMQLSRSSGSRPLLARVSRFSEEILDSYSGEIHALVFIYDPEKKIEPPEEVLCYVYGLTPAEALLAGLLAQGNTLQEACELLHVKPSTGRTHLKHIFSKTDTNRQSDLVRLVLNGPAMITTP